MNPAALCKDLGIYFQSKIIKIRQDIDEELKQKNTGGVYEPTYVNIWQGPKLEAFTPVTEKEMKQIIMKLGPSSSILDPLPTACIKLLLEDLLPDITRMVNMSLCSGTVPEAWKIGVITPLLKKPDTDPNDCSNYRPVTQLRLLTRITEHIVTQQFQTHLENNAVLHDHQSGFRPQRGTEMATADIREFLLKKADLDHDSALILLDLSAAFDTVDHTILSNRLHEVAGVTGIAMKWFTSFLTNRAQRIRMGDNWSQEWPLTCGVPQGSALSPLLFNIYLRPLATSLEEHGLHFQLYADDIQLAVDLQSMDRERLIPCLNMIKTWMSQNYLRLNETKTEIMITQGKKGTPQPQIPWPAEWGTTPTPAQVTRDLGIMLNTDMNGEAHATNTIRICNHQMNSFMRLFPLLETSQKTKLIQAMISSRLGYGSFIYLGGTKKLVHRLQKVQNRSIRLIFSLQRRERISAWREKLGWLTIASMINYKTCIWIWKATRQQGAKYTHSWISQLPSKRDQRPAQIMKLYPCRAKKLTKGGRCIGTKGVNIWNTLPTELRTQSKFGPFKKALKQHMLSQDKTGIKQLPASASIKQIQSTPRSPGNTLSRRLPLQEQSAPSQPAQNPILTSRQANGQQLQGDATNSRTYWGVTSPPLPARNNQELITRAAQNKKRNQARRAAQGNH